MRKAEFEMRNDEEKNEEQRETEEQEKKASAIDVLQLRKWTKELTQYKAGKANLESRVRSAENWWKLHNAKEEQKEVGERIGYSSESAWMHNVIVSKHADAMKAYPEPIILPREANDQQEAVKLSSIIPCVLEQNEYEEVYSQNAWKKLKTGTGVQKVVWGPRKYNGLGDIAIYSCNLLELFWEPGVDDIQKGRYFFHTELCDKDLIEEQYPELKETLRGNTGFTASRFDTDDNPKTENKITVIEVYYHKTVNKKRLLHYCKYVGETVLYASEDDPACRERGFYDHGMFPYVFDPLFPIEGSPCGYGFVDICMNPQIGIDLMRTAIVKNTVAGSTPRYFVRKDGTVNLETFRNLQNDLIPVNGPLDEQNLRPVEVRPLSGNCIHALNEVISELRETSGNTETATGSVNYGVTAASAIAALQEASGKGSADSSLTSYRAYKKVVKLALELIRQFYDLPRQFRITGEIGEMTFTSYSNENIKPQEQGVDFGIDMGYRIPEFDIKIEAAKKSAYSRLSQNEMALQFYNNGLFNPQVAEMALAAMDMMEFEGKDRVMQKIAKNAKMFQRMNAAIQAAIALAQRYEPQNLAMLAQQLGVEAPAMPAQQPAGESREQKKEPAEFAGDDTRTRRAREQAANVGQPEV